MDGVLIPWVIATTILLFVAAYWIYTLEQRMKRFGIQYQDLLRIAAALDKAPDQAVLLPLVTRLNDHDTRLQKVEKSQGELAAVLSHSVQGLGVVRYSAFEYRRRQSFSVALVDSSGRGTASLGARWRRRARLGQTLQNWRSHTASAQTSSALDEARGFVEQKLPLDSARWALRAQVALDSASITRIIRTVRSTAVGVGQNRAAREAESPACETKQGGLQCRS